MVKWYSCLGDVPDMIYLTWTDWVVERCKDFTNLAKQKRYTICDKANSGLANTSMCNHKESCESSNSS